MASLVAGGSGGLVGVGAGSAAAPSFEEVLRLQREEEEEEQREAHVQASIARVARAREADERASAAERAADDERTQEETAPRSAPLPPSSSQPSGWLTLEHLKGGADGSGAGGSGSAAESKKRWCVLMRAFLFYAGTNKDVQHPKGVVDLKGCEVALARAPVGHGAEPGSPPPHLPCAFVISHPRRPELTFTAPSEMEREQWMRAIQAAIRTPTHALLSYKGRQIFDEEDAQAIAQSREAIRGFVSEQMQRIVTQKREASEKLQRKKADIKTLKAQKKTLAQQLITMTQQYTSATQESEALSAQLTQVQTEGRCYDQAQHALLLHLVGLLNQMEECDPNRWSAGPMSSCTFSAATSPHSQLSAGPSSVHSSPYPVRARGAGVPQHQLSTVEDELIDSEWTPATSAHSYAPYSTMTPPRHSRAALSTTVTSSSSFLTPQKSSKFPQSASPTAGNSFAPGHNRSSTSVTDRRSLSARSATVANLGAVIDDADSEVSDIDLSSEQLQRVQEQLEALHAAPVQSVLTAGSMGDSHGGGGIGSDSFSTLSSSPPAGLSSLPSFTSGDIVPSLSRADTLELGEVKSLAVEALQVGLKLRLEQNMLTKYIDAWMRRKHAIALLKMEQM